MTSVILPIVEAIDDRLLWLVEYGPEIMKVPPQDNTLYHPLTGIVTYLVGIFSLRLFMRNRQPLDKELKWPLAIHNYFLCFVSLAMVVGFTSRVTRMILTEGLFNVYCGSSDIFLDRPLMWWGYVFYLSKYYELLDTVFLVLRKRPLSFLHVYHHAIVMFICWYALNQHIVMGWITCFNNASVHVLMYYYYAEQARGSGPIWWRKYLTSLQIVQFILDCTTSLPFGYFWYTGTRCRGSVEAWLLANLVGVSFFFLFLNFYIQNYIKQGKRKSSGSSAELWQAGKGDAGKEKEKEKEKEKHKSNGSAGNGKASNKKQN